MAEIEDFTETGLRIIRNAVNERYRAQFHYKGSQQFGTGKKEYSDLAECVIIPLQVQADHEKLATDSGQQAA